MPNPRWTLDRKAAKSHLGIVGVDEAGRGCLAGPVVAGAVILPAVFFAKPANRKATAEMNDSKQFDEARREELYQVVLELLAKRRASLGSGEAGIGRLIREHRWSHLLAMRRAMDRARRRAVQPQGDGSGSLFVSRSHDSRRAGWSGSMAGP